MPSTEAGVENSANKRADADGRSYLKESLGKMERSNRKLASGQILLAPFLSRKLRLRTRAKFSETAGEAPLYTTCSGFLKQPDKQKLSRRKKWPSPRTYCKARSIS